MFDLSPEKLLVLGVFAFLVLGPNRLPAFARRAGRILAQARGASDQFRDELRGALAEPRDALGSAVEDLGLPGITGVPRLPSVRGAVTSALFSDPASARRIADEPIAAASGAPPTSVDGGGSPPAPDDPALN